MHPKTLFIHHNNLTNIAGKPFVLDFLPSTPDDQQKMNNGTDAYEVNVSANTTH